MKESNYIAADFGAGSGRVMLGTLNKNGIDVKEIHRFKNKFVKENGHFFWDFHYLFNELIIGLKNIGESNVPNLKGIGIDTWGVDYGLIDKDGKLFHNPFAYRDGRTDGIPEEVFNILPKHKIYENTGIQFLQFNTIFQLFSELKNDKTVFNKVGKILFMPDLFNYFLTGKMISEYTIVSTSQMLNAKKKEWDSEILSALKIPTGLLSDIIFPGRIIGKLLPRISETTKLKKIDVLAIGSHDTASAIASVPVKQKNWAYLSSGTWSLIGIETEQPIINKNSFEYGFTNEGGVKNTNRFLKNTTGLWILEQVIKIWQKEGKATTYSELLELAKNAIPFKFIINPDDNIFLNPENMIEAINQYLKKTKQNIPQSQGEYVRCILESLALKYKFIMDRINDQIEEPVQVLHIIGGGSKNKLLNQFTSNALGIPVIAGPVEATAIGNILVQAIAKGDINNLHEGRKIVEASFSKEIYQPEDFKTWQNIYQKIKVLLA